MLYFTSEVFCRLANHNRGYIRAMLELNFEKDPDHILETRNKIQKFSKDSFLIYFQLLSC